MNENKGYTHVTVLGAGESGVGAALLAKKKGLEAFVSDNGIIKKKYKNVLSHYEIAFEEGGHTCEKILQADEIIKSPGIPDNLPLITLLKKKHIPVISEIEFAGRYCAAKKICITGSNGKTTTTLLTGNILSKAGLNTGIAGNIGKSFAGLIAKKEHNFYVLEISSFQLDGMYDFKADIAVILNITPDHLDRYNNEFSKYINSKLRIIQNQTNLDAIIYCADDEIIEGELSKRNIVAKKYPFSIFRHITDEGACLAQPLTSEMNKSEYKKGNKLIVNINGEILEMTLENLALQGRHNIYNSMAAGIAARILDIRKETIRESLSDFQHIEHRLEYVARVHGIEFINDSKATNINATWYALESVNKPIIWVAGGIDKGNDYSQLQELVRNKVKAIICLGLDNTKLIKAFSGQVDIMAEAHSAEEAVQAAYQLAADGETVLLSPACASFDLFNNYEDRGRKFKNAVKKL